MPNHVVCLKHGKKYSAEYVNLLFKMVSRHLTVPFNFVCFTEDPTGLDMGIQVNAIEETSKSFEELKDCLSDTSAYRILCAIGKEVNSEEVDQSFGHLYR